MGLSAASSSRQLRDYAMPFATYRIVVLLAVMLWVSCTPTRTIQDPTPDLPEVETTDDVTPLPVYTYQGLTPEGVDAHKAAEKYLEERILGPVGQDPRLPSAIRINSVVVDDNLSEIRITFHERFAEFPIRMHTIATADSIIRSHLRDDLRTYDITMFSMGYPLHRLIPNLYQTDHGQIDYLRRPIGGSFETKPVVRNLDQPWQAPGGLQDRHVALWHSHGWYYDQGMGRWRWQRPRLFNTAEDLLPMAFVLPYITPMLEAAGASVWLPRERDIQHHMVILDNDDSDRLGTYIESQSRGGVQWSQGETPGFSQNRLPLIDQVNPFTTGTFRHTKTDTLQSATITWTPEIPETGEYAVYISYASVEGSTSDARYTVFHTGGSTHFSVNQQLAGGTWIYLGHFRFLQGQNTLGGSVQLSNESDDPGKKLTADAVRFGGGMGVNIRAGRTSARPRFTEAARYNLQFSGMPDSLTWKLNENNDYTDDFQSRGEWVNYLRGTPFGPNRDRSAGFGIPIEASIAFHTDAGVTRDNRIVGTLSIYSLLDSNNDPIFPDGMSRLANRDFTDIMQTEIVSDIQATLDTSWTRRALRNARYSESLRPNVPSTLLELLSHQNFRDMQYAMDPHFRFLVSRSIYKSVVKFVANQHGFDYVIQPLPVTHMHTRFEGTGVRISWQPQTDPLEPTANADKYILYTRLDDGGFDNGKSVDSTSILIQNLTPGTIYSFKVRAANAGGVSFPSEVVSVMRPVVPQQGTVPPTVLIINGFTRVSMPALIDEPISRGFAHFLDAGVPDGYDIGFTGEQYNYDVHSDWIDDDRPGHGASHADFETRIIAGNTRDFAHIHGKSIKAAGFGFVTASEAAVASGMIRPADYRIVNVILGNQRQIKHQNPYADSLHGLRYGIFSSGVQQFLREVARNRGGIFVSGAHVGTDLVQRPQPDSTATRFAAEILGYVHSTNHASRTGEIFSSRVTPYTPPPANRSSVNDGSASNRQTRPSTPPPSSIQNVFNQMEFQFNTSWRADIYRVDAPDAIRPANNSAVILLRYRENEFGAAIGFRPGHRSLVFGFPFETVLGQQERDVLMRAILNYLTN
jgi:hypothetical protein